MEAILRIIKEYRAAVLALVPVLVAKSEIFGNEATEIIVKAIGAERATADASLTNCHVLEAHSHLLKDIEMIDNYLDRLSEQRLSEITHASHQIASTSKAFAERVGKRLADQRKARL